MPMNAKPMWNTRWSLFAIVPAIMAGLYFLLAPHAMNRLPWSTGARLAYESKLWQNVADQARSRLKEDPSDLEAIRYLARSSARLGRDDLAASLYNDRIGRDRMEAEDRYLVGLVLSRQGQEDLALDVWTRAYQKSDAQPELLYMLANLLARKQHIGEASEIASRLVKIPDWEARGSLLLGLTKISLEDHVGAVDALKRGLELDPVARGAALDPKTYQRLLARNLLHIGKAAEAERWLKLLTESDGAFSDHESWWLASRAALQQGKIERIGPYLTHAGDYRSQDPLQLEPSPYTGQSRCISCHADEGKSYSPTRHNRTYQRGEGLLKLPRPEGPMVDPDHPEVTHTLVQVNNKLKMVTRVEAKVFETLIDYAFGTPERYVTMIGRDREGNYRAVRKSFFHTDKETGWGRTSGDAGSEDKQEDILGQVIDVRDGVVRCLGCHTTNPRSVRNPDKDEPWAEANDPGIGCERCHGPGLNHQLAMEKDLHDRAIVNVTAQSPETSTKQCQPCHIVGTPTEIAAKPADPRWARSPGLTMTFSRCYTESGGRLGCLNCHDPHRDAEKSSLHYERKCLECHSKKSNSQDPREVASKATVCKVNSTTDCLSCHMPKVPMPVLHTALTDHYIRVHRDGQLGNGRGASAANGSANLKH